MVSPAHTLGVISPDAVEIIAYGRAARYPMHRASSLDELRAVLERTPAGWQRRARTLDLIGHSRRGTKLLGLGRDTIDIFDRRVAGFFRRLAADGVLPRLGIVAVRLLGCETATTPIARRTIRELARILGVRVYGARARLGNGHYGEHGFDDTFAHLLVEAAQLNAVTARRSQA